MDRWFIALDAPERARLFLANYFGGMRIRVNLIR